MIVWRGFGIAAFLLGLLGLLAGVGLSNVTNDGAVSTVWLGVGLAIAGVATFALGWWLNVVLPSKREEKQAAQRQAEHAAVAASANAGDLHAQAGVTSEAAAQKVRRPKSVHTFFYIPMQWWGVVWVVLAVLLFVISIPAG